jgi:hypothetical protein
VGRNVICVGYAGEDKHSSQCYCVERIGVFLLVVDVSCNWVCCSVRGCVNGSDYCRTLFGRRVPDREEVETSAKESKLTSGKALNASDEMAETDGEDQTPEKAEKAEDIHTKVAKKTAE